MRLRNYDFCRCARMFHQANHPKEDFVWLQSDRRNLLSSPQPSFDDPVKVDSKHSSVEFENDEVRVLRIRYGPHEKSVMHYHPKAVAISFTKFPRQIYRRRRQERRGDLKSRPTNLDRGGQPPA